MSRRGPLADSYAGAAALVVCALVPFLLLTAAVFPLATVIGQSLQLSPTTIDITIGLSNAAYAFGTVLAIQFAVHLPARRMLLGYVSTFFVAAVLAAWAPNGAVFIGAYIVEGLCTSLMLIAAVPPLVTGWPVPKLPYTATIMNLCIFGAVALGPTVGALQASTGNWRPLFWGVAAVAGTAVLFAVLTFEDQPPRNPDAPWDIAAVAMAAVGCGTAFYGASELQAGRPAGPGSLVPLLGGVLLVAALVVYQYRSPRPLMPVKQLATTFPVTGILIAMFASAPAFGLMELVLTTTASSHPVRTGLLFFPEFGAAVLTAGLFGLLFRTRYTPVLAMAGLFMLIGAAALLLRVRPDSIGMAAASTALIGLGVGASVSPALFMAGLSLPSSQIQQVFALIELIRGVTAFLVAPILIYLAQVIGGQSLTGVHGAVWICLGMAIVGSVVAPTLFLLGGGRLQIPDLERWTGGGRAWESPPLLARARRGSPVSPQERLECSQQEQEQERGR